MKKTWIKVKRGILEQKHIDKLGQAWYLYFYILDQADWGSGKITGWKDEYAADELGKPIGLIREHRKKLANEKYIRYEKGQHDQTIIINNWTDPRRYDFHVINPDNESLEESEHSNDESLGQSSGQTIFDPSQNNVPSYNHISHNHSTQENARTLVRDIQRMIEIVVKLPPSGPADIMAMDEIEAMNPIQEDIQEAYNFLIGQGKRVTRYTSLPGCIRTAIAKRLQKATEKTKKYIGKTLDGVEHYE